MKPGYAIQKASVNGQIYVASLEPDGMHLPDYPSN